MANSARGKALASDIQLLRRAYTALHPGHYRYNSQQDIDRLFNRLEDDWSRTPALPEVYLSLFRMLAEVRCGHSCANFYNQSDAVVGALFAGPGKLPFLFTRIDGAMVVTDPQGTEGMTRGDTVLQVNGRPSGRVLKALLPCARPVRRAHARKPCRRHRTGDGGGAGPARRLSLDLLD